MSNPFKPKENHTPHEQALQDSRNRMQALSEAGFPKTEITPEMKQELRDIIGEDTISKRPGLDPNTGLQQHYANTRPAYSLDGISFEHYEGEESWDNAWKALREGVTVLKERNII